MTYETKRPWNNKKLRRVFNYSDTITYNYSQSDQDIWVLSMLDGLFTFTLIDILVSGSTEINITGSLTDACNALSWVGDYLGFNIQSTSKIGSLTSLSIPNISQDFFSK